MKSLKFLIYLIINTVLITKLSDKPSNYLEFKINPIGMISSNKLELGLESGYKNIGFGLNLGLNTCYPIPISTYSNADIIPFECQDIKYNTYNRYFKSSYYLDLSFHYYLKNNRRDGFSLVTGLNIQLDDKFITNLPDSKSVIDSYEDKEKKREKKYHVYLYLIQGIEYKIEINNFLSISNSIEIPINIYRSDIKECIDITREKNNKELKYIRDIIRKISTGNRSLGNFNFKLMEIRLTF